MMLLDLKSEISLIFLVAMKAGSDTVHTDLKTTEENDKEEKRN